MDDFLSDNPYHPSVMLLASKLPDKLCQRFVDQFVEVDYLSVAKAAGDCQDEKVVDDFVQQMLLVLC